VCTAVLFMIRHYCRLWHSATKDSTRSSHCARPGGHMHGCRPLGSGRLGRWDARRQCIALCAAPCVHGSSTAHMLRVRVSTFTRMLACVTRFGNSDGAVRVQPRDHWFGPRGSYRSCPCPGII
jgi:hypothetical protein